MVGKAQRNLWKQPDAAMLVVSGEGERPVVRGHDTPNTVKVLAQFQMTSLRAQG